MKQPIKSEENTEDTFATVADPVQILNQTADLVLMYRPKLKTKAAKRRARVLNPVYDIWDLEAGDEIHNLHGGLFVVPCDGTPIRRCVLRPTEHSFHDVRSEQHDWPLDKMMEITVHQKVSYAKIV